MPSFPPASRCIELERMSRARQRAYSEHYYNCMRLRAASPACMLLCVAHTHTHTPTRTRRVGSITAKQSIRCFQSALICSITTAPHRNTRAPEPSPSVHCSMWPSLCILHPLVEYWTRMHTAPIDSRIVG